MFTCACACLWPFHRAVINAYCTDSTSLSLSLVRSQWRSHSNSIGIYISHHSLLINCLYNHLVYIGTAGALHFFSDIQCIDIVCLLCLCCVSNLIRRKHDKNNSKQTILYNTHAICSSRSSQVGIDLNWKKFQPFSIRENKTFTEENIA